MTIPLNDIEQYLVNGWINTLALDLSRVIESGQVVTIILSDDTFTVPAQIGSANIIGSRQKQFTSPALLKVRVLQRDTDV